jgi:hypothetical protein
MQVVGELSACRAPGPAAELNQKYRTLVLCLASCISFAGIRLCPPIGGRPGSSRILGSGGEACCQDRVSRLKGVRCPTHRCSRPRSAGIHAGTLNWLTLETRQLLNATIHCREIWSPTQQCGGVSETPADVDIRKNHLANHFGRHPPPLGDLLLLPTRADRTFRWPSPTNEPF